jgi:hypothetical protein
MREEVVEEEEKCQHHLDRACTLGKEASLKGFKYVQLCASFARAVADWPEIRLLKRGKNCPCGRNNLLQKSFFFLRPGCSPETVVSYIFG